MLGKNGAGQIHRSGLQLADQRSSLSVQGTVKVKVSCFNDHPSWRPERSSNLINQEQLIS